MIPGPGRRFGCNLISTITNRGRLAFMVFSGRFTAAVFCHFLARLLRQQPGTVFLILDRHPVHRARAVQRWVQRHAGRLQLFYLPAYSPELNPDEYLNQDVKANAVGRRRSRDKRELLQNVRGYLRSTQRQPDIVQRYFQASQVRYAAD